jgi:hypothetical protein
MRVVRFEPTIPASARPQTCALDRAATGIGLMSFDYGCQLYSLCVPSYPPPPQPIILYFYVMSILNACYVIAVYCSLIRQYNEQARRKLIHTWSAVS